MPFGLNRNSGIGWRRALNQLLLKYDSTIVRQQLGKAGRGRIGAVDARPCRVTPGASAISRPSLVKLSASVSMGAVTAICGVAIVGGRGAAQLARKSANKAARKTAIMGVLLNTHSASRLAARCKPFAVETRVRPPGWQSRRAPICSAATLHSYAGTQVIQLPLDRHLVVAREIAVALVSKLRVPLADPL